MVISFFDTFFFSGSGLTLPKELHEWDLINLAWEELKKKKKR